MSLSERLARAKSGAEPEAPFAPVPAPDLAPADNSLPVWQMPAELPTRTVAAPPAPAPTPLPPAPSVSSHELDTPAHRDPAVDIWAPEPARADLAEETVRQKDLSPLDDLDVPGFDGLPPLVVRAPVSRPMPPVPIEDASDWAPVRPAWGNIHSELAVAPQYAVDTEPDAPAAEPEVPEDDPLASTPSLLRSTPIRAASTPVSALDQPVMDLLADLTPPPPPVVLSRRPVRQAPAVPVPPPPFDELTETDRSPSSTETDRSPGEVGEVAEDDDDSDMVSLEGRFEMYTPTRAPGSPAIAPVGHPADQLDSDEGSDGPSPLSRLAQYGATQREEPDSWPPVAVEPLDAGPAISALVPPPPPPHPAVPEAMDWVVPEELANWDAPPTSPSIDPPKPAHGPVFTGPASPGDLGVMDDPRMSRATDAFPPLDLSPRVPSSAGAGREDDGGLVVVESANSELDAYYASLYLSEDSEIDDDRKARRAEKAKRSKLPRWLRWAEKMSTRSNERDEATSEHVCPACSGPASIDILDRNRGIRHMSCDSCFKMWQEVLPG